MKTKIFLLIVVVFCGTQIFSQNLTLSNGMFYRDGINPSSFLNANEANIFLLYNNQYAGFEGHPNTEIADFSMVIHNHKFGLYVVNDIINFDKMQEIKGRYARKFLISDNASFSLGLAVGMFNRKLNHNQLTFEQPNDPLSFTDTRESYFDYDFGVEFQLNKFSAGLSVAHLGKTFDNTFNETYVEHFYFYGQYMYEFSNVFRILPSISFRYWQQSYLTEVGVMAFYKTFWLGTSYTDYQEWTYNTGAEITKNIMFGYAYKVNMNSRVLGSFSSGTHEIFLNFKFTGDYKDVKTPRFID